MPLVILAKRFIVSAYEVDTPLTKYNEVLPWIMIFPCHSNTWKPIPMWGSALPLSAVAVTF